MPKYENIDQYIDDCSEDIIPLFDELRVFVHKTLPGAKEGMQFGVPVFLNSSGVPVIYLFGSKDHVNFGFLKFAELSDPDGLLQGSGEPSKHIKIIPGEPIDKVALRTFINQCEHIKD